MLTAAARPQWPAAVSPLVVEAVTGPVREARVLGAFPTCVYLDLGTHDAVLALLARDALQQPIGLRVAATSREIRWGVEPGDTVPVGGGHVRLPGADIVASRMQHPSRVTSASSPDRVDSFCAARALGAGDGALAELARDLAAAALAGRSVATHLRGLIGAGRGLTPSGDDAVSGVLLALRSVGQLEAVDRLASELLPLLPTTTSISAALLRAAAEGYAVPEVVALVDLLAQGPEPTDYHELCTTLVVSTTASTDPVWLQSVGSALARVHAIGHSSGRDLVSGVAGAHRALSECPTPHATTQEGVLHG